VIKRRVREADHSNLAPERKMSGAIPPFTPTPSWQELGNFFVFDLRQCITPYASGLVHIFEAIKLKNNRFSVNIADRF
jgi:hypothetical protein